MDSHLAQIQRLFPIAPITYQLSMHSITQIVVDKSRVGIRDIMSHSRRWSVTDPRHVAWWLCRRHLPRTYHQMARYFDRDHATVINGVQRIERMRNYPHIAALIQECENEITGGWE